MRPGKAVVRKGVEAAVVCCDAHNSVDVERDGEVAKEDGKNGHKVEHNDGEASGKVRDASGGVGETVEGVEPAIEERALIGPEHLEVALGPAGPLLESLLCSIWSLTNCQVLLQHAQSFVSFAWLQAMARNPDVS